MKTIFESSVRQELISRIATINTNNSAQWGRMSVYQMVKHCTIWDEWVLGKNNPRYGQGFLGYIFGKMALNSNVKDDRPIQKNMPTGSAFLTKDRIGNVEMEKQKWIALIAEYAHFSNPAFIHDFFGKMTKEQIGIFAYKHSDHHLRQFRA